MNEQKQWGIRITQTDGYVIDTELTQEELNNILQTIEGVTFLCIRTNPFVEYINSQFVLRFEIYQTNYN